MPHASPAVFIRTVDDPPCVVEPTILHGRGGHASECLTERSAAWAILPSLRGSTPARRVALCATSGSGGSRIGAVAIRLRRASSVWAPGRSEYHQGSGVDSPRSLRGSAVATGCATATRCGSAPLPSDTRACRDQRRGDHALRRCRRRRGRFPRIAATAGRARPPVQERCRVRRQATNQHRGGDPRSVNAVMTHFRGPVRDARRRRPAPNRKLFARAERALPSGRITARAVRRDDAWQGSAATRLGPRELNRSRPRTR